jgi:ABC-type dipeptide/oligopeptide/nickel transport system permease component
MENISNAAHPFLENVEAYGKTSLELLKLKSVSKTADVSSTLISKLILYMVIVLFAFTLTVALGLWLGELFGKNYYGFFAMASGYGLVGLVLYLLHPKIKSCVNNSIVNHLLN